jgi:hypothetical protein
MLEQNYMKFPNIQAHADDFFTEEKDRYNFCRHILQDSYPFINFVAQTKKGKLWHTILIPKTI